MAEDTSIPSEDGEPRPYNPPGFLEALKDVIPRPKFQKGRPASGTAEEAQAINYIDTRERRIGAGLSALQVVLGIVLYFEDRKAVVHAKKGLSVLKAHQQTLSDHHLAPYVLIVNVVLGLAIAGGVVSKRRALVGFTILLGGFGMTTYGGGVLGILYIAAGLWIVFRSMRRTASARANLQPAGATSSPSAEAGRATGARHRPAAPPQPARKPPAPSKRYTPPRKPRRSVPKPQLQEEPEKESRLTSWLKR